MTKYTLYLVTYERGTYDLTGKVKPYHWSYFTQIEVKGRQNLGIAHQLRGVPGNFRYDGPENIDLAKSGSRKDELEIGEVEDTKSGRIDEILKKVRIERVELSSWNCQSWALDGFNELKKEGFIYDHLTPAIVQNWLKET